MKTISTLISDIYDVIEGNGGWDETVSQFFTENLVSIASDRFSKEQLPRDKLSLSMLGTPCDRKIWYKANMNSSAEPLNAESLGTFFYGDILEVVVIALAKAAGHNVQGLQEKLDVFGIKGHGDCIIDGWVVDVKSASKYGFDKFAKNNLREDDPFGYISQLSSYLYGYKDDHRVTEKEKAAFLVVKKDRFKLCLDVYDLKPELATKELEVQHKKDLVAGPIPEERVEPVKETIGSGKNRKFTGNEVLGVQCSYCEFKKLCWPEARIFLYAPPKGPTWFTKVVKEPRVQELKSGS